MKLLNKITKCAKIGENRVYHEILELDLPKEIKVSKYKNRTKEVTKVEDNMSNKGNKKAAIPEKLWKLINENWSK